MTGTWASVYFDLMIIARTTRRCRSWWAALSGNRFSRRQLGLATACVAITVAGGCGKKTEAPAPPPAAAAPAPAAPQAGPPVDLRPAQPKTLAVAEGASTDAVLQQMNRELMRWIVGHRRAPKSFEEFVANAQLTVPPPPPGKKYVLGRDMKIVLK